MNRKQPWFAGAIFICLAAYTGQAQAEEKTEALPEFQAVEPAEGQLEIKPAPHQVNKQPPTGKRYSLSPLPVDIYVQPNLKPTVAFTTPCIMIEKMTNGFPPVMAFENFMFEVIGNINESDLLPVRIEPVCI